MNKLLKKHLQYLIIPVLFAVQVILYAHAAPRDRLVLASNGQCRYQVILPEQYQEPLEKTARLISEAFASNGFPVAVVTEDRKDPSRPGIYLGDTRLARENGIWSSQFRDWGYRFKVVGEDLVIGGSCQGERLGVVKGVCDFLHNYAGTRFLAPGGTGIEFLGTPVISVPADLDHSHTPMLKWNFSGNMYADEWLYNIATNHFYDDIQFGGHMWHLAVPYEDYFHIHPEYFALIGGKRLDQEVRSQYCISNARVMELITRYLVGLTDAGAEIVYLAQPDGFRPCECGACYDLYGTGDDWDDKVWLFHIDIARAVQKERPDAKVLMLSYQATTHPPKRISAFPENTMVLLSHTYKEALDEWSRFQVPAGYAAYLQNFGNYFFTNYLPKRTPVWLEAQARRFHEMNIIGLLPDAAITCYGLEGPLYYVWGRMFDDPTGNHAEKLLEEYYSAAFGQAVEPMRAFFGILHDQLEYFSEWLGPRSATHFRVGLDRKPGEVDDNLDWVRVPTSRFGSRGMHRGITDPAQVLSIIYQPGTVLRMEAELEKAEAMAGSDKVKRRLALVRQEMDYLKHLSRVNYLYNAYRISPDRASLDRLAGALDGWHLLLDSFYDPEGKMKPVPGWPEMHPFRNSGRGGLGLVTARWWKDKEPEDNPFAWDRKTIRTNPPVLPE